MKSLMWAIIFFYFSCSITVVSNGGVPVLFEVLISCVAAVPVTCKPTDHSVQHHSSYLTLAM